MRTIVSTDSKDKGQVGQSYFKSSWSTSAIANSQCQAGFHTANTVAMCDCEHGTWTLPNFLGALFLFAPSGCMTAADDR